MLFRRLFYFVEVSCPSSSQLLASYIFLVRYVCFYLFLYWLRFSFHLSITLNSFVLFQVCAEVRAGGDSDHDAPRGAALSALMATDSGLQELMPYLAQFIQGEVRGDETLRIYADSTLHRTWHTHSLLMPVNFTILFNLLFRINCDYLTRQRLELWLERCSGICGYVSFLFRVLL